MRFPGQWFHAVPGLHQNWMRDYDPTLGRYLQADPLGLVDGASVYGYALQNPGRYVDPRGEETIPRPPSSLPGGPYTPNPKGRPGSFLGPKQLAGQRWTCQWVPKGGGGLNSIGYWKVRPPGGAKSSIQRFDRLGNPVTAEQAHPKPPGPRIRLPGPIILVPNTIFNDPAIWGPQCGFCGGNT
ncbi:RHS repeat-associated core domain-containing protein [Aliishimia ponticola]|uniref:RHS repeat-associated core domain-containing protein n=1 Tax=Aliishimia ponticola TaxID=2499833 RepID=UPI003CCC7F6C